MSLINRMLDDLAARQAPGAETLDGVRLSDPMGEAQASLNLRTRWVLVGIALVAAILVWFVWPTRGQLPVPQPRMAVGEAGDAQATASGGPAPAAASAAGGDANAPLGQPFTPSLRMAASLGSLRLASSTSAFADGAGRPQTANGPVTIDEQEGRTTTSAAVPSAVAPRAPTLRAETSIRTVSEPAPARRSTGSGDRRASRSTPPAPPPAATSPAGILAADGHTPVPPSATSLARDALSRGDPAAALAMLGPAASVRDAETAALRAAALQRLGRHGEAADAYRGLTQGDPTEPGHWVGLAISLEGQRKREEARIAYRRALQSSQLAPSLRAFAQTRLTALEAP